MQTWTHFAFAAMLTVGGISLSGCQSGDPGVGPLYGIKWGGQETMASGNITPANQNNINQMNPPQEQPAGVRHFETPGTPTTNPSNHGETMQPDQMTPPMDQNK